jgi:hypothetical protein
MIKIKSKLSKKRYHYYIMSESEMADTERQHRSRLSIAVREAQVSLVCFERDRRHGATRELAARLFKCAGFDYPP